MKIFDSRKSIVMASIGVLFATLALVSCEKREEPLLNDMAKYSKTVVFTEQQVQTRATAYTDYNTQMPDADYVLRAEESTDSMFLSAYVTDLESEQLLTRATETTTENLGQFRILAYNVGSDNSLGINEGLSQLVGKNSNGTWSYGAITGKTEKNWSELGNNTVKFYAYANLPTADDAVSNTGLPETQFRLTLPRNATEQTDIIVAEAAGTYRSNNTQQVPLQFNHICAGIKFVVGNKTDISGYIKSIKINNVVSQGLFDIQTQQWSELSSASAQTLIAAENLTSNGASGAQVGSTLMVIPQALGTNTTIDVEFQPEGNKPVRTLSVTLSGSWDAGKMYTYKISNHKIDLLAFISQPPVQDAHYVICPVEISLNSDLKSASLRATIRYGENGAETTLSELTMRGDKTTSTELNYYENRGYWVDNTELGFTYNGVAFPKRANSLSWDNSEINGNLKTIYLFIPENISNQDRYITLTLTGEKDTDKGGGLATSKTLTIKQFCPTSTGCERIEENPYQPWGPYWSFTGDSKIVQYEIPSINRTGWNYIFLNMWAWVAYNDSWIIRLIGRLLSINPTEGVTPTYSESSLSGFLVDYSSYLEFSTSPTDGRTNTQNIYNGSAEEASLATLLELQANLEALDAFPIGDNEPIAVEFESSAIISAVKKNKFILKKESNMGQEAVNLYIEDNNINWYLPAYNEMPNCYTFKGEMGETILGGIYWTSTTSSTEVIENSLAFDWDNRSNNPVDEIRSHDQYKCRAVRAVTNGTTFQNGSN